MAQECEEHEIMSISQDNGPGAVGDILIVPSAKDLAALPGHFSQAFALMLLVLVTSISTTAFAIGADELFADGNRLFRDDLYWAALLRYRQASDAGMSTPLLHYNMGVAHYKAKQHIRARESLLKASRAPGLAVLSHYNLGLNAWRAGNPEEALRWFRLARDQEQNPQIRTLAIEAIRRIRSENRQQQPSALLAQAKQQQQDPFRFELRASVGAGVDSNVFRSPSQPYVDLSNPNRPLIVPEVQEGFFIPVRISAKYSVQSFEHESFFGAYRFGGRFYQDSALTNGNEYLHQLSFGSEYSRREEGRSRRIYSAFTVAQHDEVFFDRDTGAGRTVNATDIEDRFNYLRYGPEFLFRQSYNKLAFGARGKAQIWNYDNTREVPEYDHEYFLLGLNAQYRFMPSSLLRVTADVSKRKFGERPSFELDGSQPLGNKPVEYNYIALGITIRQRVTRSLWFSLDYIRTDQNDLHVGYNNLVRDSYGTELHWRIGNRFDFEASAVYQIYDYANAFAFQNPVAGRKKLERGLGRGVARFYLTPHLTLLAEYRYEDVRSNDARIAYDRSRFGLSLRWDN